MHEVSTGLSSPLACKLVRQGVPQPLDGVHGACAYLHLESNRHDVLHARTKAAPAGHGHVTSAAAPQNQTLLPQTRAPAPCLHIPPHLLDAARLELLLAGHLAKRTQTAGA
jgi:hypothetical protein